MSDTSDFNLDRLTNILQSGDKGAKSRALREIKGIAVSAPEDDLVKVYPKLSKHLAFALSDQSESTREGAAIASRTFFERLPPNPQYLPPLLPPLRKRLASELSLEPSEEVRLILVRLLDLIVPKYVEYIGPFTQDVAEILAKTIADSAPEVKKASCQCAVKLSSAVPGAFHSHSKLLVPPLLEAVTHQHWRTRVAAVEAIGSVIQYGDGKLLPDTTLPLAKRLFDDSPHVRLAVTKVVGNWLLNLYDRYSFFASLMPIILTSLSDEDTGIVSEAQRLWSAAGLQYLKENENDFKDKLDYLVDSLDHYPEGINRPNLGCRALMEREGGKFILALGKELTDWVIGVRIKSSQLLVQAVLHAEANITQQLAKLIGPVCRAAMDPDEPKVVQNVMLAGKYLGYFVPPKVICKLIVEHMKEANYGELRVVSAMVKGAPKALLLPHLPDIRPLLGNHTFKVEEQDAVLGLIDSLFFVCGKECAVLGDKIFETLLSVIGLSSSPQLAKRANDLLDQFCLLIGGDRGEVLNQFSPHTLEWLSSSSNTWSVHCYEQFVFTAIVNYAGEVVRENLDIILNILKLSLGPETDPEVNLKMIIATNDIITNREVTLPTHEHVNKFTKAMLSDILLYQLTWRAGRSAEAIRTGTSAALYSCLSLLNCGVENEESILKPLIPLITTLVEDFSPKTRVIALNSFQLISTFLVKHQDQFSPLMEAIVKRLDDGDKGVRSTAICTIQRVYEAHKREITGDYVNNSLLEFVFATLLIHLDDKDPKVQADVLECLKCLCPINSVLLLSKIRVDKFRDKGIAQDLVDYIQQGPPKGDNSQETKTQ